MKKNKLFTQTGKRVLTITLIAAMSVSVFGGCGKKASRLPQACWLKFRGYNSGCEIRKMGKWISPKDIVGSPLICATDYGIRSVKGEIESLDAVLVAPFGRRLLDFEENPSGEDLYFNLYNNIWNTNFPMWYSDDTRFRFVIKSN